MKKNINYFNSVIVYNKGIKVEFDGKTFKSKKDNNVYHIPNENKDDIWWELDDNEEYDYIEFHCPHCGRYIYLCVHDVEQKEVYTEDYNCSCGKGFKVEYDRVLAELNINTGMYLKD